MSTDSPFTSLVQALKSELQLLRSLRDLGVAAHGPLVRLDVPEVEALVMCQQDLLRQLAEAALSRATLQEQCLPPQARGIAGGGGLATTVTLHALIARAPTHTAARLRQQRDALRQVRDEIAMIGTRNEILIAQVLDITDHIGEALAAATSTSGYDAAGKDADVRMTGELFTRAI